MSEASPFTFSEAGDQGEPRHFELTALSGRVVAKGFYVCGGFATVLYMQSGAQKMHSSLCPQGEIEALMRRVVGAA